MRTVHEMSRVSGVSIRTLQYYDRIGLLHPAARTEAGYRLYDGAALERLQQILLYRELEFPLGEIRQILDSPSFDRGQALEQQITLLQMKKERMENLIRLARNIQKTGGQTVMDFSAFDTSRIDEYAAQARAAWGHTPEYLEYEQKTKDRSAEESEAVSEQLMEIFERFGIIRHGDPSDECAQNLVRELQAFITGHYSTCSDAVLSGLGQMYAAGGSMTDSIDRRGGEGTAAFAAEAIRICCAK